MMAGWLLYSALTTLLLVAAGAAAERLARALGAPTRAVWSGIVLGALSLSAVSLVQRMTPGSGVSAAQAAIGGAAQHRSMLNANGSHVGASFVLGRVPPARVQTFGIRARRLFDSAVLPFDQARWQRYDAALAGLLATLAAAGLLVVGGSLVRLHRLASTFTPSDVDGVSVLLSPDTGPAVLGVFRPHVVIPAWVLTLTPDERRTILLHEQEHAAARDPMLVLLGIVALVLQPWNLALWFAVARLRFALEADCDGRVLRRSRHSATRYGALLLEVCERELAGRMSTGLPVSAFVDSTSHLERRVRRMTDRQPRLRSVSTAAALVVALVGIAAAFTVRVSSAQAGVRQPGTPVPVAAAAAVPTITPVAPDAVHDSSAAEVTPTWQRALPRIVNTQREAASSTVRVVSPGLALRWLMDAAAPDRRAPRDEFVPETLTVRPSNSLWPMRARIIPRDADPAHPVTVTDTLGRLLPTADTLVVEGPVRLILPDAGFQMTVESLSGDLMMTTSPTPAKDGKGGYWVSTLLGRSFHISRDAAGAAARFSGAVGVMSGKRIP